MKEEPNTELTFEQILINENVNQYNCPSEESSSMDSFDKITTPNQSSNNNIPPAKRKKQSKIDSFQFNGSSSNMMNHHNAPDVQELQVQLLRKQIEVQELMATELRCKIERTQQLIKMDAIESELRCKEITKRIES